MLEAFLCVYVCAYMCVFVHETDDNEGREIVLIAMTDCSIRVS